MTDEISTPPPPAPDPPPTEDRPAGDVSRGEFEQLRDKVDDVEAIAHSAVQMQLEDDVEEPLEEAHTDVEPRGGETPAAEHGEEPAATPKHSGLFI